MSARPIEPLASTRSQWFALLALLVAVLALYARTAAHGFVAYDDPLYVSANEVVQRGLTLDGLRWAFGFHAGNWHPLTWLAHMLDVELFADNAGGHHLVSAALHALNALLLFMLVRRWTGAGWTALFVAALFALHPLRVESVAWASERKDVLAGSFWLLTLLVHERFARRGGAGRYALLCATFALGLMAKSMLVTLPLVLLFLDLWPLERMRFAPGALLPETRPRLVLEKLPLLALALAAGSATFWIQQHEGALGSLRSLTLPERACNAFLGYWIYLYETLVPLGLTCFVPHPVTVTPREELASVLFLPGLVALLGLLVVSALLWRLRRSRPHLLVGWAWYLLAAAPVIGFVQVGEQAYADRYTYLPLIGPVLALAFELRALVARRPHWRAGVVALALAWLLALVPLTWRQIGTWRDSRTLFAHALVISDDNFLAASFLGEVERLRGELPAARAHFEQALEANKTYVPAMLGLGLTLEQLGELGEAKKALHRALRNDADNADAQRALERVERRLARPPAPGAGKDGK
ncbi:MAG: tetratricopeptide repeat protein [Planctomycetes bacterium]|nr:tetratricopeptide repeat protein [Planctomycetota bacterium]